VADRFGIKEGDSVDLARLVEGTGYVFGMGDFDRVDIMLDRLQDEGAYDLLLRARDNSLGPNYLRFGVALESNIEGTSSYNILLDYTRRWINAYGAEWKTLAFIGTPFGVYTEFYQPLSSDGLFFIMPHGKWIERPVSLYKGDERVAEYSASQYSFGFDIGIQPWMYGIAKVGLLIGEEDVSLETGDSQLLPEEATFSRRGIIYSGTFDQLDNVHFPNEGSFASVTGFTSLGALGADESYSWLEGSFTGVASYKRQTFLTQLSAGSSLNGDLPFHEDRKLGGFLNLSGLQQDQLRGDSLFLAKVVSYYKAGTSYIGDLYLGGSIETGNVWDDSFDFSDLRLAGSLFVGYDTLIGPFYIGLGMIDGGELAGYFYLGRTF
jgi:NTE family protein